MNGNSTQIATRRPYVAAVTAALVLMLGSGAGYRVLAHYLSGPTTARPLPPGTLARLPLEIGQWRGKDVPLDEEIVKRTGTDDHVNRQYSRSEPPGAVWMFLAYGVRARDLAPHRPDVCYPGAGWTLVDAENQSIELPGQNQIECRIFRFTRGGLSDRIMTVLSYYIVDGRTCPDVSLLRSKSWGGSAGIRYMAQVQIACPGSKQLSPRSAEEAIRSFAAASTPVIEKVLSDATAEIMSEKH